MHLREPRVFFALHAKGQGSNPSQSAWIGAVKRDFFGACNAPSGSANISINCPKTNLSFKSIRQILTTRVIREPQKGGSSLRSARVRRTRPVELQETVNAGFDDVPLEGEASHV